VKELLYTTFGEHQTLIIYLHVISAVVWVGGMVAMRFAAHHSFMLIEEPAIRLARISQALKRLFTIVTPFVITLIVTAIIMAVGLGFRAAAVDSNGVVIDAYAMQMYNLVHVKEVIWMIMSANLAAMMFRRRQADKLLAIQKVPEAKVKLALIGTYMVPINIGLGLLAIYLGVTLRHAY
jgi:uncharacterized membrane protein